MEHVLDKEAAEYLYKCLLKKRKALALLRPIDPSVQQSYDNAMSYVSSSLSSEEIHDIDKQMSIMDLKEVTVYVDASVKDNDNPELPKHTAVSFIVNDGGNVLYKKAYYLGTSIMLPIEGKTSTLDMTANVAEYVAIIKALEFLIDNSFSGIATVFSDSELAVKQINHTSRTRSPKLLVLRDYVCRLMAQLPARVEHLDREHNTNADALCKAAHHGQ